MITLITYPPQFGEASASPFCIKAAYLLNASGLSWQREDTNDPRKMPHAKLPVLRTDGGLISGSDNIAAYVAQHGTDLDADLTPPQKATSHALIRMTEEHLYFLLVLDRWERDDVWPSTRDAYFHEIPSLLRGVITGGLRRKLLAGLKSQGLGRLEWTERMVRARQDLAALRDTLGDAPFLFGEKPTVADAAIAPILSAILATPFSTELSKLLRADTVLPAYVARVKETLG